MELQVPLSSSEHSCAGPAYLAIRDADACRTTTSFLRKRPRACVAAQIPTALFVLPGFALNSTGTFCFDPRLRWPAKSLLIERHGTRARNDLNIFKLQRLTVRGQQ